MRKFMKEDIFKILFRKRNEITVNGNISINGYLVSLPEEYFEYVLLHELTHLYYLNHSRDFWEMMSSRNLNWKHLRRELSQYKLPSRHTPNH